ncbi:MAG: glycosyltransferase [Lachnospiraceae bacterium]|jgi:glycosyltransferase involved in cell wall biosynthesis|nr:glycosyltransferase [Lachnospiraceae bacterium]
MGSVWVVIPSYEPDERLFSLCKELVGSGIKKIVVVDDGSGEAYDRIFNQVRMLNLVVLTHFENLGKGRALKTAFNYLLVIEKDLIGCVTADSDGQHTVKDIIECITRMQISSDKLLLGCRVFNADMVPWKSRVGNTLTKRVCQYLCGLKVSDTQTGLRGIPGAFMRQCLSVPGERFEFETNMLLAANACMDIDEFPIETVYDSKTHHRTHFDPIRDSIKIYKIFGRYFMSYILSSLSSALLDLYLFDFVCTMLRGQAGGVTHVIIATIFARTVSSVYNYFVNYKIVFKSRKRKDVAAAGYFALVIAQMVMSAAMVSVGVKVFPVWQEVWIKIMADAFLFFVSYKVQQQFVFS